VEADAPDGAAYPIRVHQGKQNSPSDRCLVHVSLAPRHSRKGDQQNHDAGGVEDVSHHGKRAGSVARVGPMNPMIVPTTSTATAAASQ